MAAILARHAEPVRDRLVTPSDVRDVLLAGHDDELIERLADLALSASEQREASHAILREALGQIRELSLKLDRVRQDNIELRERVREFNLARSAA